MGIEHPNTDEDSSLLLYCAAWWSSHGCHTTCLPSSRYLSCNGLNGSNISKVFVEIDEGDSQAADMELPDITASVMLPLARRPWTIAWTFMAISWKFWRIWNTEWAYSDDCVSIFYEFRIKDASSCGSPWYTYGHLMLHVFKVSGTPFTKTFQRQENFNATLTLQVICGSCCCHMLLRSLCCVECFIEVCPTSKVSLLYKSNRPTEKLLP